MRARTITVAGSLLFHVALGVAAIWYAGLPKTRKAHTVAVMGEQKKKEEKREDKPKPIPPPKPRPASKSVEPAPIAPPVPQPEAPPPKSSAPPRVNGDYSNNGGGSTRSDGNSHSGGDGPGMGPPGPPAQKTKVPVAKKVSEEDACTEAPTKPSPVNRPTEIEYTQEARANGIEGRLVLKIIVGADGAVAEVIVVKSVDPQLDAAAVAAVKSWVFKPAQRCGKPSDGGVYMVAQRFELGD